MSDLGSYSMEELFKMEVSSQTQVLIDQLLELEKNPGDQAILEQLMRAAHSLKGAARLVGRSDFESIAHKLEDEFIEALEGRDVCHIESWLGTVDQLRGSKAEEAKPAEDAQTAAETEVSEPVTDRDFSQLLALSGEMKLVTHHLNKFYTELSRIRSKQLELVSRISCEEMHRDFYVLHTDLSGLLEEFDEYERRLLGLAEDLHSEALESQMYPFERCVVGLKRFARDLAQSKGKEVELQLKGLETPVGVDILSSIEAPIRHLVSNAIAHGIEEPQERAASGKASSGSIVVNAYHRDGRLRIEVEDDGTGISLSRLKAHIVERGLSSSEQVEKMTPEELYEFLFLPGFTTSSEVDQISGRGVGLDAVRETVSALSGNLRTLSQEREGTTFQLSLPIALSLLRSLILQAGGFPYAIALQDVVEVCRLEPDEIFDFEGTPHWLKSGQNIPLFDLQQLLAVGSQSKKQALRWVVILKKEERSVGFLVEDILGEESLVIQPLDPRLGKLPHVSAGAIKGDGGSVIVLDPEDLLTSCLNPGPSLLAMSSQDLEATPSSSTRPLRVLVADDSLTVRESHRRVLENAGYTVDTAVDGAQALNLLRQREYNLLVSDVDMPRLDGFELVARVRQDVRLSALPVILVSYKDREADRLKGLQAGADHYLSKGSYHDQSLLNLIEEFLGAPV